MTRRCSHCNHDGHNSRTCPNRGVKIFGVRITDGSIRKSASMGNLTHYPGSTSNGDGLGHGEPPAAAAADGYASEDFAQGDPSSCRERKKGVPWTEEEHRLFLLGLHKLGKGDWRGISRNYVVSRTPTQVASHAQKYFIRQTNASRRKRRTSLFDIVPDEHPDEQLYHMSSQEEEPLGNHNPPPLPPHPTLPEDCESMASNVSDAATSAVPNPDTIQHSYPAIYPPLSNALKPEAMQCSYPMIVPAFVTPYIPFPYVFWPGAPPMENKTHEVLKPIAMHRRAPMIDDESLGMSKVGADEVGRMSKLSLKESNGNMSPSFLSLKQPDGSNRHSAFHPNLQPTGPSSTNVIPAV